ncbi:hypothetical protein C8Q78DRAFT_570400 [Trametes maxima]|nr:hypothetical protein C8Q78DRAFT_570400 [Trametes maxima]
MNPSCGSAPRDPIPNYSRYAVCSNSSTARTSSPARAHRNASSPINRLKGRASMPSPTGRSSGKRLLHAAPLPIFMYLKLPALLTERRSPSYKPPSRRPYTAKTWAVLYSGSGASWETRTTASPGCQLSDPITTSRPELRVGSSVRPHSNRRMRRSAQCTERISAPSLPSDDPKEIRLSVSKSVRPASCTPRGTLRTRKPKRTSIAVLHYSSSSKKLHARFKDSRDRAHAQGLCCICRVQSDSDIGMRTFRP